MALFSPLTIWYSIISTCPVSKSHGHYTSWNSSIHVLLHRRHFRDRPTIEEHLQMLEAIFKSTEKPYSVGNPQKGAFVRSVLRGKDPSCRKELELRGVSVSLCKTLSNIWYTLWMQLTKKVAAIENPRM